MLHHSFFGIALLPLRRWDATSQNSPCRFVRFSLFNISPVFNLLIVESCRTSLQIVLKREIIDSIEETTNEEWRRKIAAHKAKYPEDPLPIPFNDLEPQVMIPYKKDFPWHVQIHRDSFSYGEIDFKADPRVVVDLRFFGKSDILKDNKVTFAPLIDRSGHWEPGVTDIYGMPQATVSSLSMTSGSSNGNLQFEVTRTNDDGDRDQRYVFCCCRRFWIMQCSTTSLHPKEWWGIWLTPLTFLVVSFLALTHNSWWV